ncbi:MAG TPA: hypothetical protein PLE93_08260 [Solirubrobacterales bacterium]|nr:hypothetical protein [Solirubrobacterales bacterium]
MNQSTITVQTIGNLTIDRTDQTVHVDGKKVPTLLREFQLIDQLARCEAPATFEKLGRKAFAASELRTAGAVEAVAHSLRAKLTSYGARRGLVHINGNKISMFTSPQKVRVQAFHVPSARYTAGPEDGSVIPDLSLCDLIWFGELPESDDRTVLEQTFHLLNIDTRPNRLFAPALTVGDIVTLQPGGAEAVSYQVDHKGWIRLRGTVQAAEADLDLVENQLAA